MSDRDSEKIVLTGVKPEEIQVALGYLGVSGYEMKIVSDDHETKEQPRLGYASRDELVAFASSHSGHGPITPLRLLHGLKRLADWQGNISGSVIYKYQEDKIELFKEFRVDGKPPESKINLDTLAAMISAGVLQGIPSFGNKTEWFARDFVAARTAALEEASEQQ